jgi:hypothetical protein
MGRAPSYLAPLAGRGRNLRACARIPGEGQTPFIKRQTLIQPTRAPHPNPLPASGARECAAARVQPIVNSFTVSELDGSAAPETTMTSGRPRLRRLS